MLNTRTKCTQCTSSVLKGAWRIVGRVALPNRARKLRSVVQFPWELAEGSKSLVWLIEEIGVVEEMIRRKVPSLRGFALEWWRLKMQTTFAGRTKEAIAWSEFLDDAIVPLMCKTVEEAAQRAATLERSIQTRQVGESGSGSFRLPQQSMGASKGKAPAGPSSSGFGKWGQKWKQAFKGKGRRWGGRSQFQQGRGRPEVEESQQSTARQPITPPGYRCYNCNQPGHLIRNCPYPREYGYGRGVQQQQQ
ncbi:hypothetical protein Taro_024843 [Colocasia esculenta]|uniref:CCHC-type domain-containing protein n=1 Tax=Colocasia esculenta TaxID=4460 RepID=A0A843VLL1_COLES|nr:hypothetical protein [Colocasia esculenta]